MHRGSQRIILPNPHRSDLSGGFVLKLLRDYGISVEEWESTR